MSEGLFAKTWYDDNSKKPDAFLSPVEKLKYYDFLVIGGGLAGLVVSLRLIQGGATVALLESNKVGSGASGRNGGFCSRGWSISQKKITKLLGVMNAKRLDGVASKGYDWMVNKVSQPNYQIVNAKHGELTLSFESSPRSKSANTLNSSDLKNYVKGPRYKSGKIDYDAFQFNPLNFLRILSEECSDSGVHIFQDSEVKTINSSNSKTIFDIGTLNKQNFRAQKIIFATGGYGGTLSSDLSKILLSIKTFIAVSEPIPILLSRHIPTENMIADNRRAGNYFRRLEDGRLLWGMGISAFGDKSLAKIKDDAFNDLAAHIPSLAQDMKEGNVEFEYAWSGNMAYGRDSLPYVGAISNSKYSLTGFGGHGMNTAPGSALCLADCLLDRKSEIEVFEKIKRKRTYGSIGKVAAESIYKYLAIRDIIAEYRS